MSVHIDIDLNVRVRGGQTYVGFEDVKTPNKPYAVGDKVTVWADELVGDATITEIDTANRLIFLAVDWPSVVEPQPEDPNDVMPPEMAAREREWIKQIGW